jgi:hypothetical protein
LSASSSRANPMSVSRVPQLRAARSEATRVEGGLPLESEAGVLMSQGQ